MNPGVPSDKGAEVLPPNRVAVVTIQKTTLFETRMSDRQNRFADFILTDTQTSLLEKKKMTHRLLLCGIAVLVLLAAIAVHGVVFADTPTTGTQAPTMGETEPDSSIGRYQIAVYAYPEGNPDPGVYIIDTATGELWMNRGSEKPRQISGPIAKSPDGSK